ncbi:MAG TPA: GGDEF domain-containing protein [Gaiellaceae bacterium]|nr:GGDEF domain-containing protein [Gaiellaceae bacterium]
MSTAVRHARPQRRPLALGLLLATVLAVALRLVLSGARLDAGIPTAVVLVALVLLAKRVSTAGPFVVAASLVGGPLVGVCAGVATDAGTGALQGFVVGLAGEQLAPRGVSGAVAAASMGLLTGLAFELVPARRASWPSRLATWVFPAPLLAAFLYVFETAPGLALALAAGLLLMAAVGNVSRLGLEQRLAKERSRARVDPLTSAPNRYALAEALGAEQARIRRGGRTAALCFLDLDRFKTVNDTYGYAAGDALLVDLYERLRAELRASDVVFRWGGEEFVVLAPHVERPELADFAERLRLLVATRPFAIDGRPRTITGSVGAVLLDETRPAERAVEEAGRLVRKAKLTRNTAVVERTASSLGARDARGSLAPWPADEGHRHRLPERRPRGDGRHESGVDPARSAAPRRGASHARPAA